MIESEFPKTKLDVFNIKGLDIQLRSLLDFTVVRNENCKSIEAGVSNTEWPISGVLWKSAPVLIEYLLNRDLKNKAVLDVGCGVGLLSVVLKKKGIDVTATDFNPISKVFLNENLRLNDCEKVDFELKNWIDLYPEDKKYDFLVGSDLVYEKRHVEILPPFLSHRLKKDGNIIIAVPKRSDWSKFQRKMNEFGFTYKMVVESDSVGVRVFSFNRPL